MSYILRTTILLCCATGCVKGEIRRFSVEPGHSCGRVAVSWETVGPTRIDSTPAVSPPLGPEVSNSGTETRSITQTTSFTIQAGHDTRDTLDPARTSGTSRLIDPAGELFEYQVGGTCDCGATSWELVLPARDHSGTWAPEAKPSTVGNASGRDIEITHDGVTVTLPNMESTTAFAETEMSGSWRLRPLTMNPDERCPRCPPPGEVMEPPVFPERPYLAPLRLNVVVRCEDGS